MSRKQEFELKPSITETAIEKMRRRAKRAARAGAIKYSEALEREAKASGFLNWHAVTQMQLSGKPEVLLDLPVDPKLPKHFYDRSNGERSATELRKWWNKPYARSREDGTFDVRCLDGGAHDRPTFYGVAPDLAAARERAATKLSKWLEVEKELICTFTGDSIQWVQYPHDPRKHRVVLAEFPDDQMDMAKAWKAQWLIDFGSIAKGSPSGS